MPLCKAQDYFISWCDITRHTGKVWNFSVPVNQQYRVSSSAECSLNLPHLPDPPGRWIIKKRTAARTVLVWVIFSKRNRHCSKRRQRRWWVVGSCGTSPFKENRKKSLFFSLKTEVVKRTHVKYHSYTWRKKGKNALETKRISVYKPVSNTQDLILQSSPVTYYS